MTIPHFGARATTWHYSVWRRDGLIEAVVGARDGEYVYCRIGTPDGLAAAARTGARRPELDGRPPEHWRLMDTFRAIHYGVGGDGSEGLPVPEWEVSRLTVEEVRLRIISVLAGDLVEPSEVATLTWPNEQISSQYVSPSAAIRPFLHRAAMEAAKSQADADRIANEARTARLTQQELRRAEELEAEAATRADVFTFQDLQAAARGVARRSHIEAWGEAVLTAVESHLHDHRLHDRAMAVGLLKDTARCLARSVSPFDGYMEAPPIINDLAQRHSLSLHDLEAQRDRVLIRLLDDVTAAILAPASGALRWSDLARFGAAKEQPPAPVYDEDDW